MQSAQTSQEALHAIQRSFLFHKNVIIHPQGTSMFPLLVEQRDSVTISPLADHKFRKGDLLLYQRDSGLLVLHRLCSIQKEGFYFVGDNQTEIEGPIPPKKIIAVVTKITRKNHTFSVNNCIYQLYSKLWLFLRPIRPYIAKLVRKLIPCLSKNRNN